MKISFIGLGIMGSRMAANLVKKGVEVTVYNRSKEAVKKLEQVGAIPAKSPQKAVENADIVFSMLSTPEVVSSLFFGNSGLLSAMKKQSIWVDCSTVNPAFSRQSFSEAEKHKIHFLDAPVAGTKPQAENAELVFFVGGDTQIFEFVQPFFEKIGKKSIHLGKTSNGTAFKMLVNMMLAQSMLVFSEAILLGEKMGFERDFLLETIPNLVVSPPFTKAKADMIASDDYEVQFPLEWMHKDLHLASLTAYELGQPLYLANLTKELFADAKKSGYSRLDFAAIHRFLSEKD